ncbi:hypothetical protein [Congregibacter sp.]|uniref:hypothetical protein n=1 Tax=Congregibacter sp. TaxID=2744308 RepID=UPI0039E5B541
MADTDTPKTVKEVPPPTEFVTEHTGTLNGRKLKYRARAGETYIHDENEEPSATFLSFDYVAINDGKDRPVTFA